MRQGERDLSSRRRSALQGIASAQLVGLSIVALDENQLSRGGRRHRCSFAMGLRKSARRASALMLGTTETRNSGETARELLLRREAEVVLGRDVARCWATARFVRFLQLEAADPSRRTYREAPSPPRDEDRGCGCPTSCLRTTGVVDHREAGRPGCCFRPDPSVSACDPHDCFCSRARLGRAIAKATERNSE